MIIIPGSKATGVVKGKRSDEKLGRGEVAASGSSPIYKVGGRLEGSKMCGRPTAKRDADQRPVRNQRSSSYQRDMNMVPGFGERKGRGGGENKLIRARRKMIIVRPHSPPFTKPVNKPKRTGLSVQIGSKWRGGIFHAWTRLWFI